MDKKEPGYVYILTNPSFREDWVKIGKSSRPVDVRSKELDNTSEEYQLEKTDHNHLGHFFAYAAGLDAVTIIRITEHLTEEHRATIDWLNRITDKVLEQSLKEMRKPL